MHVFIVEILAATSAIRPRGTAWVRMYGPFVEERLECFKILKYDIESELFTRSAKGEDKGYSRTRDLDSEKLLEQLPSLQQLLYRLMACKPEGAAISNYGVVQYALALVLKESFKIYCAINDGIINLIDKVILLALKSTIPSCNFHLYFSKNNQDSIFRDRTETI
ncbi:putative ANTH domain-containing protein [Helianthus debilis subsp. tardiflorus]